MGVGEDQEFEGRAVTSLAGPVVKQAVNHESAYAIYRWGTGSEHVSGYGANGYELMAKTDTRCGTRVLEPHWREDYVAKTRKL